MLPRFRLAFAMLPVLCLFSLLNAGAQAPIALPYTMTTIGGLAPMSTTAGTQCPNQPAGVKSTDAYGDGCLAINGIFGAAAYGGVLVDSNGNLYVVDDTSATPVVHQINQATGIMTKIAGANTACSGKLDSVGDGCVAATGTALVNNRSANLDYYGNILMGGYADHLVHMICLNASPLCGGTVSAATPIEIPIGNMGLVAGCAGGTGSSGTTGTGLENTPGFSYSAYSLNAFKNSGACSTSLGEVNKPEGITGDVYGNIYYADSAASRWRVVLGPASYKSVTNPLYAVLQLNSAWPTVTAGYVYTISAYPGAVASTKGSACSSSGTATDGFGDGCLFTSSFSMGVTGYPTGMGVDAAGNMIYTDLNRGLRVFYVSDGTNFAAGTAGRIAGQKMMNAIIANIIGYTGWNTVNSTTNPPPTGYNYMLAGTASGGTAIGTSTPATLGSGVNFLSDNKMFKLAVSPQGNIYIGDSGGPARVYFYEMNTGFVRTLFVGSANVTTGNYCNGASGQKSLSAYSDGCPVSKSLFSNGSSMSVGVDPQGNLYMYDGTEPVIRKVLAQGFGAQTYNTTPTALTQTFQVHLPESATLSPSGATAAVSSSPDITVASGTNPTSPSCLQNGDNSVDCTVTVTTAPTAVGLRSAALTVTLPAGSWQNASATINLNQAETGSVLVADSAAMGGVNLLSPTNALLSGNTPAGVALDGAGNLYEASGSTILQLTGGITYTLAPALAATPSQIAVDPTGNIFAVNSSHSTIMELAVTTAGVPSTYATASVSYTPSSGSATPQAIATDQFGSLYVADYQTGGSSIYKLSYSPFTQLYQNQVTVASGLQNPVSLAVDSSGNVFVADKTAGSVIEYSPASGGAYTLAKTLSMTSPVAVAVDPAGDLYVQAGTTVTEFPVSGPTTAGVTVFTGLSNPVGLAVDGFGNVYSADAASTSVTQVVRDAATADFGTSESTPYIATLTNVGNLVTTASTALGNVNLVPGTGSPCAVTNGILGPQAAGLACTISAEMMGAFSSSSSGPLANTLAFTPAPSTFGSVAFIGTLPLGVVYPTTTTISAVSPSSPVFQASGTEATFTVTVFAAGATNQPANVVSVTVDTTTTSYPLDATGVTTVALSGLKAGNHSIYAKYSTNGFFTGSDSGVAQPFTIAQATTTANWTTGAKTQQVSQAIGTGVLNATASTSDPSVSSIAGNFVYTAAGTTVDASSYLGIGTYPLAVTFYPTDSTDYSASSSVSGGSLGVTQASTTASVGATTMLVAPSGGNYTSLSAALAALPVTGGSIYLAPGTYTGQNAISYPNVFLRGLGGDPTKVILTGENGAFAAGSVYPGYSLGPAGKGGDEGSAVLDVSKNGYMGTTAVSGSTSPYGFYADYLTIQNTYNTNNTTTTTANTVTANATCTAGQAAQTLKYLYDNQLQCNSQALAMWLATDQAILNNVNQTSQQDTLYAGYQGTSGSTFVPARQYIWKGLITGDVDYIFGDAALVLDGTNIFTTWHSTTAAGGTETIEAQNKRAQTGSSSDYLSGYICNGCTLLSQSTGMTKLYYGRPYGVYSTWVMLNSFVDQVNPAGWMGWDGASLNLNTSTYAEYNTQAYTDPAVGTSPYPATLAGGVTPTGGNTGSGATSFASRETYSRQLTAAQAAAYSPVNFLSTPVSTTGGYSGMPTTWNPVTALAARVNSFASTGTTTTVAQGSSVTILGRPQTPGAGIIPTGAYTFYDGGSVLATGNLDASGEAFLTTSSLTAGTHSITLTYSGDTNFVGSTSNIPYIVNVTNGTLVTPTMKITPALNATYGSSTTVTVTVLPGSGGNIPSGTLLFSVDNGTPQTVTLSGGAYTFTLSSLAVGNHSFTALYEGDSNFLGAGMTGYTSVSKAVLQVAAGNATMVVGGALPSLTYSITGFVSPDTQASAITGAPALSTLATGASIGEFPIAITTGTLAAANYTFAFSGGYLFVTPASQAAPVATGDTRTVTEPTFPAVCQQLTAAISQVNDDIPAVIDAAITNPDGARIQAALNACSVSYPGSGQGLAVQLSMDGAGHNAFLSGPLSMPSNVTLLVDPGVVLFFSRNAQDYDKVPGTHTCGNITNASATSSCVALIDVPKTSTNVAVMGYGKLDGRGGDPLINAVHPYEGFSWWGLSDAYASPNSQQNPRWFQMQSGSSNITLYKITFRNAPLFHVTTGGAVNNFTAWDIKIVTPTTAGNTDGIDPGNMINGTITRSWVSDGDDNVAVGGAGTTAPAANISITNNHFFAGHGQSIGSYTGAGVSNILWDGNMAAGNSFAGVGAASITQTDTNSTGIRIKSANDRGGLVTGIQYSNECLLDHKADIQFTPLYNTNTGTLTPNFNNILIQNVVFMNDYTTTASSGTAQFTGAVNGTTINPLQVTLDNVTFPSSFAAAKFTTTGTAGTETNAQLTYGPGQVSSNFVTGWATFVGSNGDTVTDNRTASSLNPPACSFTYIAPELTGPAGLPQTITQGQNATAVVILTPAVGGAAYPTGTVTLTDALTSATTTVPLSGTTDTFFVPLTGLTAGTHTFTATYSGDANYPVPSGQSVYTTTTPYVINVINAGSLGSSSTALALSSGTVSYGTSVTATATVTGNSPAGSVQFVVSGGGLTGSYTYATIALTASTSAVSTAATSISLPYSTIAYSITAVYSGDPANAGSTSSSSSLTVGSAVTQTVITANTASVALGNPFILTANVTSVAGTPTSAAVTFAYSTTLLGAQTTLGTAMLNNGATTFFVNSLPVGSYYFFANYPTTGSFGASASAGYQVTVTAAVNIVQLPSSPIALPYTITTIAGGSGLAIPSSGNMACTGATNKYGDGCQGTAMSFTSGDDMRAVTADPFGNVYLTDISATRVRRIAPNGVITTFAGGGSTCTPPASTSASGSGCTPTLAALNKPRGVSADAKGNIFIADYSGNKVYEVKVADGLLYLVAGTGTASSTGDGGPATSATINAPRSAWDDSIGNIYIAETGGYRIRVVDTMGNIHTFAGTGTNSTTGDGAPATAATVSNPQGVFVDANLNVYIADSGGKIRVVCVTCGTGSPLDALLGKLGIAAPVNGNIYTIAGNGSAAAYAGTYPILGTSVSMATQKLSMDNNGNLYISDSNGFVWMLDFRTGYIRAVAANGTVCAGASNTYGYKTKGDGCPATQASFGSNGGNGFGAGTDTQGNLYISDSTNGLIRKVITGLASPSTVVAATTTLPVQLHFAAGDTVAASNALAYTSTEWTLGTPACTLIGDTTSDCLFTSGFTPAVPGARSTPLTVNSLLGNKASLALSGTGLGAGATLDPASKTTFGASLSVAALATDTAGNVYVSDATSKKLLRFAPAALTQGVSATSTALATLTAPGAVAIDPRGFVYVADTSTGLITQITPAGTTTTLPFAFTTPSGLAADSLNNLYVSDSSAKTVYQVNPITGVLRTLSLGTLVSPKGMAVDPSGNLLIADSGAPAIYRFNLQTGARTTVATTATAPTAVLVDAAGNLLIADAAKILAVPASANSAAFTVATLTPVALAIDSVGNLFTGSGAAVLKLTRTQGYFQFAGSGTSQTVSLLDSGNQSLTISSIGRTDTTDYTLAGTASADCMLNATLPSTLVVGGACSLTATYAPTTFQIMTDTATFNGNFANTNSVQLMLTGPAVAPDFTVTATSSTTTTVIPGRVATYTFSVSPTGATAFPAAITFSATGLPAGATAVFTPASLAAGAGTSTVTLNIQTSLSASAVRTNNDGMLASRLAPFSLALLLLPFAVKLRKAGRRFSRMMSILLLLAASAAAIAGLSGCGSNTGMFGHPQKSYTVVITATSGTLVHTSNVNLTIE